MDLFEAIEKRASYRESFLPEPIPEADIRRIVEAGIRAPSGYNYQTTSFLVVTDSTLLSALSELMPSPATRTAPVMLVLLSKKVSSPQTNLSFEIEDYAASAENILLAITALGYAGVWMDGRMKLDDNEAAVRSLLRVPEEFHVRTIIPFGKPIGPVLQKEKRTFSARVTFNRF